MNRIAVNHRDVSSRLRASAAPRPVEETRGGHAAGDYTVSAGRQSLGTRKPRQLAERQAPNAGRPAGRVCGTERVP